MSERVGDFIVQTTPDGPRVIQADERISVSPEFFENADPRYFQLDGDRLTLLGLHYAATGEMYYDNPVYRRVMNEGDL